MGDAGVFLLIVIALIIFIGSILGWMNYKIDKLEKEDKLGIETIGSIIALEKAMKKLNEALRSHDRRLDDQLHELSNIKERLDILESGHPDSDIDYGEVDDDANVIAVWFNGKKYIPEDKWNEDTNTFHADNKVVAETTRGEVDHLYVEYKNMSGNGYTEQIAKCVKELQRLNLLASLGGITSQEWGRRWKELMRDDT